MVSDQAVQTLLGGVVEGTVAELAGNHDGHGQLAGVILCRGLIAAARKDPHHTDQHDDRHHNSNSFFHDRTSHF